MFMCSFSLISSFKTLLKRKKDYENIYSPSCHSKPVWVSEHNWLQNTKKILLKNVVIQTDLTDFHSMDKENILKKMSSFMFHRWKSYRFRMTSGWVHFQICYILCELSLKKICHTWEVDKSVSEYNGKISLIRQGRYISMKVLVMNLYLQVVPMAVIGSLGSSS